MADWGTYSSWGAAGISAGVLGVSVWRDWWHRPLADWSVSGRMVSVSQMPSVSGAFRPNDSYYVFGMASVVNFGDGDAHRVSVNLRDRPGADVRIIGAASLLRPGERLDVHFAIEVSDWTASLSEMWVTWTPPPIRRRRVQTSHAFRLSLRLERDSDVDEEIEKVQRKKKKKAE
ncbi:hypothetical protein [Nocardia sp. NPDC050412]|uniref:hypothetical protein n=1 Tax=Nocardia sp. NPDC050412 TaxID=3364320 RepID=UPI0037B44522